MARLYKEEKERIKATRSEFAKQHIAYTEKEFAEQIRNSITHSRIYSPDSFSDVAPPVSKNRKTEILVCDMDTVSAAYKYSREGKKNAVLNFADFTRVGGGFMQGQMAQEEALCSESVLYSVQNAFHASYYGKNALMKAEMSGKRNEYPDLYCNRALYSEDVIFIHNDEVKPLDVITCAAPNFFRGKRYRKIDPGKNDAVLKDRIFFVLQVARDNNVDILFLGAFGCGVFSQDPNRVAELFKENLENEFAGAFETVIFPVPIGKKSKNYEKFCEAFDGTI